MRCALAVLALFGAAVLMTGAQPPKDPAKDPPKDAPKAAPKDPDDVPTPKDIGPRYGVNVRIKAYPQGTPKDALKSALRAIDDGDFSYLTAQLLDPKFVDAGVSERARQLEPAVLLELTQLRDLQRANPERVAPDDRLPYDARSFGAVVIARARERGFRQFTKDVEQKLTDDPQPVKEMRKILRAPGAFPDAPPLDPVASATHPNIKTRTLYFKKIGERWFIENRQTEEQPKDQPKKEP
jgi:hypothetical protein